MSEVLSARPTRRCPVLAVAAAIVIAASAACAQPAGCRSTKVPDPGREELSCPDGLQIAAEEGTSYKIVTGRSGRPVAAELRGGALLIDEKRRRGGGFQIRTPQAIASVRGTQWAVDVGEAQTSVFVRSGAVSVRRQSGGRAVTLRAGDGVDVDAAGPPLEVKRWKPERVAALLARFGR